MTIPKEIRTEIEKEAADYSLKMYSSMEKEEQDAAEKAHISGQESMYLKQQVEIERLKGLIEQQFFKYYNDNFQEHLWDQFKIENNI